MYGAVSHWRRSWVALLGATLVCFWLFVAVAVPFLPLPDPDKPFTPYALPGTMQHGISFLLGSDTRGRDVLSRTLWGCQRVMVWGITATAVAYAVGTVCGLIGGYLGGWWDELVSFVGNVLLSFPVMVLFILVLNVLGQSGFNIIIAVTCSSAPVNHAHRARLGHRGAVAGLHPGRTDSRRASRVGSCWLSFCPTCAARSWWTPVCGSDTPPWPSPP